MSNSFRVSLPGYNAKTDTNPDHYALYSDEDWVLIKELARGSGSISQTDSPNEATIAHNLGYIPFYLVYCEVSSGRYRIANSFDPLGSGWKSYADEDNLYIENDYSSTYTDYRYYIFYDNLT